MDPVTAVSTISAIAGLVSYSGTVLSEGYGFLVKVAKAPRDIRILLNEVASLNIVLDQLQTLVESQDDVLPNTIQQLAAKGELEESRNLLEKVQSHISACEEAHGKAASNLKKRLLWPFKEKEALDLLKQICATRDNIKLSLQRLEASSLKIEANTAHASAELHSQRLERDNQRLISWLCPEVAGNEDNYISALKVRLRGTGSWLLSHESFLRWLEARSSLMWIYGIPGSADETPRTTIIQHIEASKTTTESGLIYFFCDYRDASDRKVDDFLKTAINQLISEDPACLEDARRLHDSKEEAGIEQLDRREYLNLIRLLARRFAKIFIVIDALDEAKDKSEWLEVLSSLKASDDAKYDISILVTSRQDGDIEGGIHADERLSITENVEDDIRLYVLSEVNDRLSSGKLKIRNPQLRGIIVDELTSGANGMFLWAKLQLDAVSDCGSDRAIRDALAKLPHGLEETYIRILTGIKENSPGRALEIKTFLQCLIGSNESLNLEQLAEMVSIQAEDTSFDPDGVPTDPMDLVKLCGGLVTTERLSLIPHVRFMHQSVEEFLVSESVRCSQAQFFSMRPLDIQFELAKICIQYLSFDDFGDASKNAPVFQLGDYKFLNYAARYWHVHLRSSCIVLSDTLFQTEIVGRLGWFINANEAQLNEKYRSWEQIYRLLSEPSEDSYPPLYYTVLFGLERVLDILSPKKDELETPFDVDWTALHLAAAFEHVSVLERILSSGVEIDALWGLRGKTALHVAAERKKVQSVATLLRMGANADARASSGSNPIYSAARGGSLEILEMLRDAGSDINCRTWHGWTPLHEAVANGHMLAAKKLIAWGADLGTVDTQANKPYGLSQIISRMSQLSPKMNADWMARSPVKDTSISKHRVTPGHTPATSQSSI